MATNATKNPSTDDILRDIDELKKQGATIEEALRDLNKPVYKSLGRFHAGEGALSYWDYTAPTQRVGLVPGQFQEYRNAGYAPGYQGDTVFKSWDNFLRTGWTQHKSAEWQAQHASVYKAVQGMSVNTGEDGGFLVMPEYASGILERVYANDLFSRTDNYSVGGNQLVFTRNAEVSRANGSRHGGMRGYWVGEGGTITKSKPTVNQLTLRLKKLAVVVYLTDELIADAGPAAAQYVTRKAAEEFNFMLGDALFNGTGAGQPLGMLNAGALLSIAKETGQAASTIVVENIDKMWARRHVSNGNWAWYHNQDCGPQLDQLAQDVGTGGVPLYRTGNQVAQAAPQTLKGAPRVETEFNATVGTQGDLMLADMSQIVSITKGGISQEASIHVEFLTDQTALRFIMRVDAQPWEASPLTPYKGSNTQASFLALDTRS